ncbi:Predicted nuclease of the RNAse H fold, HicB family [Rhizobiales bacterium GAS113]|jgi:predicted RNase H-like HicB family nuclease|nr:Predicted nuclease of the RNAse H fold, HicB family [Rhizobiales bacterium GAS113]
MKRRLYPAVLERGPKGTFGAWFPDFPGCVAGGRSQEETIEKAENTLAQAVDALAEHGRPLPEPTPIERIVLPKGSDLLAYFIVGVDPPDPSERVNVYLPKSLIGRVDRRAAELGMSRSSFFGLAATNALSWFPGPIPVPGSVRAGLAEPRSKVHKTGGLRTEKSRTKKPSL